MNHYMVLKNPHVLALKFEWFSLSLFRAFLLKEGNTAFKKETTIHPFLSLFFFTIHDVNWLFVYRYSLSNYLCFNPLMFFNHVN